VTDGLGENAAGALNALVPVPASGGGRCPCARGLPIRTSLFLYSTVAGARALVDSLDVLSVFETMVVELDASTCVRILSICTLVWVPLTDILDSSPRVYIRELALEWRLFLVVEFLWGHASDPAGVAPEPLEEFLTPSRVILPNLQKRSRYPLCKALIGSFYTGVSTYSQWSKRHPSQTELLAGNPSENPCPVRGGRL